MLPCRFARSLHINVTSTAVNLQPLRGGRNPSDCHGQCHLHVMQVCLFAFDCLYLNGEPLLDAPLTRRREALCSAVTERAGELQFAVFKVRLGSSYPFLPSRYSLPTAAFVAWAACGSVMQTWSAPMNRRQCNHRVTCTQGLISLCAHLSWTVSNMCPSMDRAVV